MACWGSYRYSVPAPSVVSWGTTAPNLDRMAAVLSSTGWTVALSADRVTLTAKRGAMAVTFTRGRATLETRGIAADAVTLTQLRQSYSARTVADSAARYGYRVTDQQTMVDGRVRLEMRR